MKTFAIPDIHGRSDLLKKLLHQLLNQSNHQCDFRTDRLIFLGDMIDRGPDSKGVMDTIIDLQELFGRDHVIALRGNHEDFMMTCLWGGRTDDFDLWFANGGDKTMMSICGTKGVHVSLKPFSKYLSWIDSLPYFFETDDFFFSHAPCPKEHDRLIYLRDQPFSKCELTWTTYGDEPGKARHHMKNGRRQVGVCGHKHALMAGVYAPRLYEHYLFLDAGCGCSQRAPLIACNVETREVLWAWPDGQKPIIPEPRSYLPTPPLQTL